MTRDELRARVASAQLEQRARDLAERDASLLELGLEFQREARERLEQAAARRASAQTPRSPSSKRRVEPPPPAAPPAPSECAAFGCRNAGIVPVALRVGGGSVRRGFCVPHAAEYRTEEAAA